VLQLERNLFLDRVDTGREQTMKAEGASLGRAEPGALVEEWVVDQVSPSASD
jgi:hypothetical protein